MVDYSVRSFIIHKRPQFTSADYVDNKIMYPPFFNSSRPNAYAFLQDGISHVYLCCEDKGSNIPHLIYNCDVHL